MRVRKENLKEVYVWEIPVRIFHWLNVLCIIILCVTGFIIADPVAIIDATEATYSFWFGYIRLIHFITGFVFFFNLIFRFYWSFAGNRFAKWNNFVLLKKSQWKEFFAVVKVDILMARAKQVESVGHNAVASFTYLILFVVLLLQAVTGFALYAQMSQATFPKVFAWIIPLFGGEFIVRDIHHAMTWFFILFTLVHVYLVLYHDYIERRGETSAMIGGWKFVEEGVVHKLEKEEKKEKEEKEKL
ncbi:Ni/Fe-hydrogenase, b-type cytochrome subunit [Massilibacteroides sp.]|uniref:Ni/Fe-hydrogenase, b-type cytochrome subunit n=1 Tax=Massilibacteroides sp. TaxID=2034766 RepID=UPI00260AA467|nr:Ni/Fe-hydrogenase, b-type cytochrome subunit [Massilibacteroides sp.]MDD4516772.1 Ni/Fe-hydrogenase, b-type cytochrome subunit [Massilibacteroides sp.]